MKPITVTIAVNGNTVKTATFVNVNFYNEFKRIREAPEPLLAVRSALCKEMDYTGGLKPYSKSLAAEMWHIAHAHALQQLQDELLEKEMVDILNQPD